MLLTEKDTVIITSSKVNIHYSNMFKNFIMVNKTELQICNYHQSDIPYLKANLGPQKLSKHLVRK